MTIRNELSVNRDAVQAVPTTDAHQLAVGLERREGHSQGQVADLTNDAVLIWMISAGLVQHQQACPIRLSASKFRRTRRTAWRTGGVAEVLV